MLGTYSPRQPIQMGDWIGTKANSKVQNSNPQPRLFKDTNMSLKLTYYGQNDGSTVPDVALTGDPGTDQALLTAAGYLGGRIMALAATSHATNTEVVIVPCDSNSMVPYATLLNGPGEFSGAIGPSGSRKAPVVRALWQGIVDSEAYFDTDDFVLGAYLY